MRRTSGLRPDPPLRDASLRTRLKKTREGVCENMSQPTQGGPERLKVSISMGETAITLFGVNTKEYYFDADVMADVEARFWERFQPDGASISLTLRGMAEAMGSVML